MWARLLHDLNAKGFPELARCDGLAMAGGVPARDRHPASGRAVWAGNKTAMDLSKNPHGEKTLMHLLRDLTAKWGLCSAINCKIGLQMRCSAI